MKLKTAIGFSIISAIITIFTYIISEKVEICINFGKFFELFITAFSIIIGFLLTSATIFTTHKNEKLEFIKKSGGMESLYKSLKISIILGFTSIFVSMAYFLFEELIDNQSFIAYLIVFINIFSMILCLNFLKLFLNIVSTE